MTLTHDTKEAEPHAPFGCVEQTLAVMKPQVAATTSREKALGESARYCRGFPIPWRLDRRKWRLFTRNIAIDHA
jgi:hypothetical protein